MNPKFYDLAVAYGGESHSTSEYLHDFLVDDVIDEAEHFRMISCLDCKS